MPILLQKQRIGSTDLHVSRLCLGCADMGTRLRGDDAVALLSTYIGVGGTFLDTAHCYAFWVDGGHGASEREVGRVVRQLGIRDQVVIATKGGHPDGGPAYRRSEAFLAPNVLQDDVAASLHRLGLEQIDLYYLHRDDGKTPVGEIMDVLNGEIDAGRIRYLGASNWSVERITEANRWAEANGKAGFVISQVQMSLAQTNNTPGNDPTWRGVGADEARFHTETQLPVAAFSATANGYFARRDSANALNDNAVSRERRDRAEQLGKTLGATPTQVALAYLLHQPFPVFPVFSTTQHEHLQELLAADTLMLSPEQGRFLSDG